MSARVTALEQLAEQPSELRAFTLRQRREPPFEIGQVQPDRAVDQPPPG